MGMSASMRFTYFAAAIGMAIAVLFVAPVVLMGASSAHADISGYHRCVGKLRNSRCGNPTHKVFSFLDLLSRTSSLVFRLPQKPRK